MKPLLAILLLAGCATKPVVLPAPTPPELELHSAWEREVDDAIAGFTAVRPRLTSVESQVLSLYDAQLKGLEALAGSPTVPAVADKSKLLGPGNDKAIKDLLAAKAALDAKTTALESKAAIAERERIAAETAAKQARQDAIHAEAASNLSRIAVIAIGAGILAFLFGHYLAIPKWAATATVGLGLLVATLAPQLLTLFGSDKAQHIMLATLGSVAFCSVVSIVLWAWSKFRAPADPTPSPDEQAPPSP